MSPSSDDKLFCLVTTTINVPSLLEAYARDALEHGRRLEQMIVVGDRKTPPETAAFCARLERELDVTCRYVSVGDQEEHLSRWPRFAEFLPWNCIQRRNVGLLLAYQGDADIVVTIDDDNFLHDSDYLGAHAHLGEERAVEAVTTASGWWNVCEMLAEENGVPFYHRGHPLSERWTEGEAQRSVATTEARAVVNAGLWLEEPDVDALTRLHRPVRATGPGELYRERVACAVGTWAPFNSQNTALLRELVPAYLLFPHVGRYDDIWASYVIRHIADHAGDVVTYGAPLVRQDRNPHNYFKDFDAERLGMEHNDTFLEALRACELDSADYRQAFAAIARRFPERIGAACERRGTDPALFDRVAEGLDLWSEVFETLSPARA